jgi:hypothetical protein
MDFNYKKYSLENLENWMHDAMSSGGATPQEIYDVIKGVVEENYYTYKHQTSQAYELLALLNGNGKGHLSCDKDDPSEECKNSWTSFWEENYYPEEHQQYTEEELNAMCDAAKKQEEQRQMTYDEAIAAGWTMTADGFWIKETPELKPDKVVKWQLPVEIDGPSGEYFICFPDDLLEAANLKEGDQVNWVDNGDGSYTLTKVTEPLGMDEC